MEEKNYIGIIMPGLDALFDAIGSGKWMILKRAEMVSNEFFMRMTVNHTRSGLSSWWNLLMVLPRN